MDQRGVVFFAQATGSFGMPLGKPCREGSLIGRVHHSIFE